MNNAISRVYAVEGSCFVLAPCAVISEAMIDELCDTSDKRQLVRAGGGHAVICGPDGGPLCDKLAQDEEGLLYADIDLCAIGVAKNAMDPVGHYSWSDVHRLLLNTRKGNRVERFSLPLDIEPPHEEASNA